MHDLIPISKLNDFIFCPYSIYLHNVYMSGSEDIVHAAPQVAGKAAHTAIDENKYSTRKHEITGLNICSIRLGVYGKIDIYKAREKLLLERKFKLVNIYRGQMYQLWAQYFCMIEMGYEVNNLAFYSISDNKTYDIKIPGESEKDEFEKFLYKFRSFDPSMPIAVNNNKCSHCIYINLCDKTETEENVYT